MKPISLLIKYLSNFLGIGKKPIPIYQFHCIGILPYKRPVLTIKGPLSFIEKYIPRKEMRKLFGGYVMWYPEHKDDTDGASLGVYGVRKVSKFKRIMKERGAIYTLIKEEGPYQRICMINKHYGS